MASMRRTGYPVTSEINPAFGNQVAIPEGEVAPDLVGIISCHEERTGFFRLVNT